MIAKKVKVFAKRKFVQQLRKFHVAKRLLNQPEQILEVHNQPTFFLNKLGISAERVYDSSSNCIQGLPDMLLLGDGTRSLDDQPPCDIAYLRNGKALTEWGFILDESGRYALKDLSIYSKADLFNFHHIFNSRLKSVTKIKGKVVVLTSWVANYYYHWFAQVMPRLEILRDSGDLNDAEKIILPEFRFDFQKQSLAAVGFDFTKCITINEEQPLIEADELVTTTFPGTQSGLYPLWPLKWHREIAIAPSGHDSAYKKIYVSRKTGRSISNDKELILFLNNYDFKTVYLEDLEWREHPRLFKNAEVIVAQHGAGLINLLFCKPEAHVIEILNPNWPKAYFWWLAKRNQLHHQCVFGIPLKTRNTPHSSQGESVAVRLEDVELALKRAGV